MDVSDVNMNFFMVLTKGSNKTPIILCGSLSSDSAMSALLSQYLLGLWQLHVWLCHSFKLNASDRIYLKLWDRSCPTSEVEAPVFVKGFVPVPGYVQGSCDACGWLGIFCILNPVVVTMPVALASSDNLLEIFILWPNSQLPFETLRVGPSTLF